MGKRALTRSIPPRWHEHPGSEVGLDGGGGSSTLLKTLPTINRSTLSRLKRNRRLLAALRADCCGFHSLVALAAQPFVPSGLTGFAPLRLVPKSFVREEELFSRSENKLGPAIHALHDLIPEFHAQLPCSNSSSPCAPQTREKAGCELLASLPTVPIRFTPVRAWPSSGPVYEPKLA